MTDWQKNPFLNDQLCTFSRMMFPTPIGEKFGVSRVWYKDGHTHAGNCEVELIDGTSVLVPVEDVRVAPNWGETPEEGRFTGAEFFEPAFLDGTRRAYLSTSQGVIVPGDMDRLRLLAEWVQAGDRVKWHSHGSNEFGGDLVVESVNAKGFKVKSAKPMKYIPGGFEWPTAGSEITVQYGYEFEVNGNALHIVRIPPKRTGKTPGRSLSLSFKR